jgi:hypothetical protein
MDERLVLDEWCDLVFLDSGREPQCAPNPNFPDGMIIDFGKGEPGKRCVLEVPYPAPRCGSYIMTCKVCGVRVAMTVAGRRDDPRTVVLPCNPSKNEIN